MSLAEGLSFPSETSSPLLWTPHIVGLQELCIRIVRGTFEIIWSLTLPILKKVKVGNIDSKRLV